MSSAAAPAGYEYVRPLGAGAFATVWLARQVSLDRFVAVKHLVGAGGDLEIAERLRREARILARLRSEQIVEIIDLISGGLDMWIVMELVAGGSLRSRVGELVTRPAAALTVLEQVAAALDAAHGRGVVHRDLKPDNVLVTATGRCKVADFGIARAEGAMEMRLTRPSDILGTPLYMSPEQVSGGEVTAAADVYALGVMAYELLVGRLPFVRPTALAVMAAHAGDPPQAPHDVRQGFPLAVERELLRALGKGPRSRHRSAGELAERLRRAAAAAWPGAAATEWLPTTSVADRAPRPLTEARPAGDRTVGYPLEGAVDARTAPLRLQPAPPPPPPAVPVRLRARVGAAGPRAAWRRASRGMRAAALAAGAVVAAVAAMLAVTVVRGVVAGDGADTPVAVSAATVSLEPGGCVDGSAALSGRLLVTGRRGVLRYLWLVDGAPAASATSMAVALPAGTGEVRVFLRYAPPPGHTATVQLAVEAPQALSSAPVTVPPCAAG